MPFTLCQSLEIMDFQVILPAKHQFSMSIASTSIAVKPGWDIATSEGVPQMTLVDGTLTKGAWRSPWVQTHTSYKRGPPPINKRHKGLISACRSPSIFIHKKKRLPRSVIVKASSSNDSGADDPSIVDANMIVLRKRMHDLKLQEGNYEFSEEWVEWEKKLYVSYHSTIFQVIGRLQHILLNTRPSVAIALLVSICVFATTSVTLVFFHLISAFSTEFFLKFHG
eukprot:Gb_02070 [translate_table: standard]